MGTIARFGVGSLGVAFALLGVTGIVLPLSINLEQPSDVFGWPMLGSLAEVLPFGVLPLWLGVVLLRKALRGRAVAAPAADGVGRPLPPSIQAGAGSPAAGAR